MKPRLCLFILILFISFKTSAQQTFTISGTVTDSLGTPQKAATVFLSGTQRITASDDKGEFSFAGMTAGTFQLSVSMVGFAPYAQNVVVQYTSVKANVVLRGKSVVLREVVIGPNQRDNNMRLFKLAFIGLTDNAKECTLLNPDAVNFNFNKKTGILTANADEFLLLENKSLGYRIKYLLKDFSFDTNVAVALYDGETSFEELPGTTRQKRIWAKNRLETYEASMMHFLRAVYSGKPEEQGFAVYNLYGLTPQNRFATSKGRVEVDAVPIDIKTISRKADTSLMQLQFKVLYVDYVGSKAIKLRAEKTDKYRKNMAIGDNGSILKLIAPKAVIDARGSCSDYKTFYLQGFMANKRVGDQLPFEYQPPAK